MAEDLPVQRYAEVTQNTVTNITKSGPQHAAKMGWLQSDTAEIGDTYDAAANAFAKPVVVVDPKAVRKDAEDAIQRLLDATAQAHGYDSMLSACSYATSTNPKWKAEGQACCDWRDAVWSAAQQVQDDVLAGKRELPAVDAVLKEMPAMKWPG